MDRNAVEAWLALLYAPGIGPATAGALLARFGDAPGAVAAGRSELLAAGLDRDSVEAVLAPDRARLDADLAWLAGEDHHLVVRGAAAYPPLLAEISDPPLLLFVSGDPRLLSAPQLAIVGSRNPTATGAETAEAFAAHLAGCGLAITSGLATGIDAAAHRGALRGGGTTVAVCGTGLDRVYPAANRRLAHDIAAGGALVSEFACGTPPARDNFPRRNRLISALSLGTLVVEAAWRSGSLITAHRAIEQGREVFAIPGSIHNPLARGCHRLIREGAKLVESAQDVLEELAPLASLGLDASVRSPAPGPPGAPPALDDDYCNLLNSIGFESTSIDRMVARSGLTADAVSSMLLILELRGHVRPSREGGYVRTARGPDS